MKAQHNQTQPPCNRHHVTAKSIESGSTQVQLIAPKRSVRRHRHWNAFHEGANVAFLTAIGFKQHETGDHNTCTRMANSCGISRSDHSWLSFAGWEP